MSSNDLILQFLDGSLTSSEEAEVLHVLSVSPERRDSLRSYLKQQEFIARDRQTISVPYSAEQKLWQRLGALMPADEAVVVQDASAPSIAGASVWSGFAKPIAASVGVLTLLVGMGIGYTLGTRTVEGGALLNQGPAQPNLAATVLDGSSTLSGRKSSENVGRRVLIAHANPRYSFASGPGSEGLSFFDLRNVGAMVNSFDLQSSGEKLFYDAMHSNDEHAVAGVASDTIIASADLGDISASDFSIPLSSNSRDPKQLIQSDNSMPRRIFLEPEEIPSRRFIERFEFSFLESFGRQFPNSAATNSSLPIVTNSALGIFFQVLPHSESLWIGASAGTANLTRKQLMTRPGDPADPLQQQLVGEYTHVQTNWFGGFLQYRLPLFAQSDLTFTGGYGFSNAGKMTLAELGWHYDATRDVGFTFGVRGIRLSYDLTSERDATIQAVRGPLVIAHGAADATPSYNLELNTGLFFHF